MKHFAARMVVGLVVAVTAVVGLASNAYAVRPPDPTDIPTTPPGTSATVADKLHWMATGAIATLVVVAVTLGIVMVLSRRHQSRVSELAA